jgi:hypothetical protein
MCRRTAVLSLEQLICFPVLRPSSEIIPDACFGLWAARWPRLCECPGGYWWLYLILFSTPAPTTTALHLLVAALAVQGWVVFQHPLRRVADWIQASPDSDGAAVAAFPVQATIWWLPIMALSGPGWLAWHFVGVWQSIAGPFHLDVMEALALWIEAL